MTSLPSPTPEQLAHSTNVSRAIHDEIAAAGGWISFERYMALALYAPEEFRPGADREGDEDLARAAGEIGTTIFHPVGTARMGSNSQKVARPARNPPPIDSPWQRFSRCAITTGKSRGSL